MKITCNFIIVIINYDYSFHECTYDKRSVIHTLYDSVHHSHAQALFLSLQGRLNLHIVAPWNNTGGCLHGAVNIWVPSRHAHPMPRATPGGMVAFCSRASQELELPRVHTNSLSALLSIDVCSCHFHLIVRESRYNDYRTVTAVH